MQCIMHLYVRREQIDLSRSESERGDGERERERQHVAIIMMTFEFGPLQLEKFLQDQYSCGKGFGFT